MSVSLDTEVISENEQLIHYMNNGKEDMSISEKIVEEKKLVELAFKGDLSYDIAKQVEEYLFTFISVDFNLHIDLAKLSKICNAGMNCFNKLARRSDDVNRGSFVLANVPGHIMDEFDKIGLSQTVEIE